MSLGLWLDGLCLSWSNMIFFRMTYATKAKKCVTLRTGPLKTTRWSIVLSDELPYDVFRIALENLFSGVKGSETIIIMNTQQLFCDLYLCHYHSDLLSPTFYSTWVQRNYDVVNLNFNVFFKFHNIVDGQNEVAKKVTTITKEPCVNATTLQTLQY